MKVLLRKKRGSYFLLGLKIKILPKKIGIVFLMSALLLIFLAACTAAPSSPSATSTAPSSGVTISFPMTITDQAGRTLTFPALPQRIVSLAPSNTEILYALGLGDRVVGRTDYDDYPPEAKEKPSIGGFSTPNIEEVVAKSPDLVLATNIHISKIVPQLEARGLTVLVLDPKNIDQVLEAIKLVGQVTGKEKEAKTLTDGMQQRIKAVTDKTGELPENQKLKVLYLTWHDPLMTSGAGTLSNELMQLAGGINIFPEITGTKSIELETVIARNPQVMIAGIGMGTGEDKPLEFLKTEPRLQSTEAAINGRIYGIDIDLTGRAGPRIIDGLEQFARCIHPEIFGAP
jgi:iron complex transport system substrate-binding protein